MPTTAKQHPNGWERWRGTTDQRLQTIETTTAEVKVEVAEARSLSAENNALLKYLAEHFRKEEAQADESHITFRWVLEKVGIPLLLGVNAVILGLVLNHLAGM